MAKSLPRPPIVAILGHVDHGKTTLLDYIKKTKLTDKEHGKITQSIGAYEITTDLKGYHTNKITFIDTPGHEAFGKLRSRGATVADIALLMIDAKESVMPQTSESISHIKAAQIPFIVVLSKIDLPQVNPEKVKTDLVKHDVLVEGKGGKIPAVSVSAKTGKGIDELLESILFLASDLNLQYDPEAPAVAPIIEAKKGKRGVVVSAIIKEGQLKVGSIVFVDGQKTKVRTLLNDLEKPIQEVVPSTPFELLGFSTLPAVGSVITDSESAPSETKSNVPSPTKKSKFDLETLLSPEAGKKISIIIKADSHGSLEAIENALGGNQQIEIIHKGIGEINNSDVFLGKTTSAIILGFQVPTESDAKELAKQERVIIKSYNIIYELIDELTEVASLLKEKEEREKTTKGEAKILATFVIHKDKVYGVKMTRGKANTGDPVEIIREGKVIGKTKITSLQIRAKKVSEVKKDQEAGVLLFPQFDIRVGDVLKLVL